MFEDHEVFKMKGDLTCLEKKIERDTEREADGFGPKISGPGSPSRIGDFVEGNEVVDEIFYDAAPKRSYIQTIGQYKMMI